jgi:hypothetical protein
LACDLVVQNLWLCYNVLTGQYLSRDSSIGKGKIDVVAEALVKNKHQDIDNNKNIVDVRSQVPVAVVIANRKHAMGF